VRPNSAPVRLPHAKQFTIDSHELLSWPASDRCVLTMQSAAELAAHKAAVVHILTQWIKQL